jgi:4-hydroxy-2-oxoheptanedioate aldolase
MAFRNPLLDAWGEGRATFGTWSSTGHSLAVEAMIQPGIDWVLLDLQHGLMDVRSLDSAVPTILGRGATPLARVAVNEAAQIGRVLDSGALGVVVPLVESAEEAAGAVAACRFPPDGIRSYGPARFGLNHGTWDPADVGRVACIVMIETAAGLAAADEIASVKGLDGVLIGPSDLAISLGVPLDRTHEDERTREAFARILAACQRNGVAPGIVCASGVLSARYLAQGFRMLVVATDLGLLIEGVGREVGVARAEA